MEASQFVGHRGESGSIDGAEPWSTDDSIHSFDSAFTEELYVSCLGQVPAIVDHVTKLVQRRLMAEIASSANVLRS
jgi:hypothetical protein